MDPAQRPPYAAVDFKALSKVDPEFKQLWQKHTGKLDFQDPNTIQILSSAILRVDFGLQLSLLPDRLCPPIPNRWNYVSWIHGLIDSTAPSCSATYEPARRVTGLDIGTGSSAIYTLLCLKSRPSWTMCATDIDAPSFESASRNLALNSLMSRTKTLLSTPDAPLILLTALATPSLDFTICNPPFFASESEMTSSLTGSAKSTAPNAICTGSTTEMVTEGGDLGFATRLLEESLTLREKVGWYTILLCKLASARSLIAKLRDHNITNFAVGIIETGSATRRWVVGWSFGAWRPSSGVSRAAGVPGDMLPFPTSYSVVLPAGREANHVRGALVDALAKLDLKCTWDGSTSTAVVESQGNVWARAYRRAHERKVKEGTSGAMQTEGNNEAEVVLVVRVRVVELAREVVLEWVKGVDQVLWESFCGWLHRVARGS
jgi:23S rRNA (adenine1618-N6)-methyltransferase